MATEDTRVAGQMRILSKEGAAACALFDLSTDPATGFDFDDYLETYRNLEASTLIEALRLHREAAESENDYSEPAEKRLLVSIEITMNARASVLAAGEDEAVEKVRDTWETDERFVDAVLKGAVLTDFSIFQSYAEADGSEIVLPVL